MRLGFGLFAVLAGCAVAGAASEQRVYVCHATEARSNPYIRVEMSEPAARRHIHTGHGARFVGRRDFRWTDAYDDGCEQPEERTCDFHVEYDDSALHVRLDDDGLQDAAAVRLSVLANEEMVASEATIEARAAGPGEFVAVIPAVGYSTVRVAETARPSCSFFARSIDGELRVR